MYEDSAYLLDFINRFGEEGGWDMLLEIISSRTCPLKAVVVYADLARAVEYLFTSSFKSSYLPSMINALFSRIYNLQASEMGFLSAALSTPLQESDLKEMVDELNKQIKVNPRDPEPAHHIAIAYYHLGKHNYCITELTNVFAYDGAGFSLFSKAVDLKLLTKPDDSTASTVFLIFSALLLNFGI
jgi:hypothetical protein